MAYLLTLVTFVPLVGAVVVLLLPRRQEHVTKLVTLGTTLVTFVFAATTIATMLTVVLLSTFGLNFLPMQRLQRYSHACHCSGTSESVLIRARTSSLRLVSWVDVAFMV